jgi:hypothetical protein
MEMKGGEKQRERKECLLEMERAKKEKQVLVRADSAQKGRSHSQENLSVDD